MPVVPIVLVETGTVVLIAVTVALVINPDPGIVPFPTTRDCKTNCGGLIPLVRYVKFSVCEVEESSAELWKAI